MALIITGIFIQFLGLAVQVIQLRQGRRGEAAAADGDGAIEHARQTITKKPSLGHGGTGG